MGKEREPKIEKELTYQEKYEMVRELDLKDIEDYEFYHPAEVCPDLKEYFEEKHKDPKEGLISFTEKFFYYKKEDVEHYYKKDYIIHPLPDIEMMKKHGYFSAQTIYMCYGVFDRNDEEDFKPKQYLHEALGKEPTLKNIEEMVKGTGPRSTLSKEEKQALEGKLKSKLGYDAYIQFKEYYKHVFPSSKEYESFHKSRELFPKITFDYRGHKFEIISTAFLGNDRDQDLPFRPDNKLGLERQSRMKLYIDGEEYEELCYDPSFGKDSVGKYNKFLSWRKWCELEDLVVGPEK